MDKTVIFNELHSVNGKRIGHARLNKPKALNALDLDMVRLLTPQLHQWQRDDDVVAVVLDGEGDKAFCAGGDVVNMYHAMAAEPGQIPAQVETFFCEEYQLDFLIHKFSKPIIVIGSGIVMGGGLGLFAGASHRVVTDTSRIAMPEVTIGLYPDVGGSAFLNNMPEGVGLFLGLTGASINATDALRTNLADFAIAADARQTLLDNLQHMPWQGEPASDGDRIDTILAELQQNMQLPEGYVEEIEPACAALTQLDDISDIIAAINAIDSQDNKWLNKAKASLNAGCPLTRAIVPEQLHRGAQQSLEDNFRMELVLSCRCAQMGEFQEGVRALLVDKDLSPQWQFATQEAVTKDILEQVFTSPWDQQAHPLRDLGKE